MADTLEHHDTFHTDPKTGRTFIRMAAGGAGGGVTGYTEVEATEQQHVDFLKSQAEANKVENERLIKLHEEAAAKLKEHRDAEDKTVKADEAKLKKDETAEKKLEPTRPFGPTPAPFNPTPNPS
jgi:hypothetical protein